jgi:hypothetical protein
MSSGGPISFDHKSWGGKHILQIYILVVIGI